jgi:hypothetical protein
LLPLTHVLGCICCLLVGSFKNRIPPIRFLLLFLLLLPLLLWLLLVVLWGVE